MPKEHRRRRRQRHEPLGDQIDADNRTYKEVKKRNEKEIKEDEYIPADLSRKILNMAHEQQMELRTTRKLERQIRRKTSILWFPI